MPSARAIVRVLLLAILAALGGATAVGAQIYGDSGQATATTSSGAPGSSVTLSGSGFQPNSPVVITFESDPVTLATVSADGTGTARATVVIPADAEPGQHTLRMAGVTPAGAPRTLAAPFTVTGADLAGTGANTGRLVAIGLLVVALGIAVLAAVAFRRRRHA